MPLRMGATLGSLELRPIYPDSAAIRRQSKTMNSYQLIRHDFGFGFGESAVDKNRTTNTVWVIREKSHKVRFTGPI